MNSTTSQPKNTLNLTMGTYYGCITTVNSVIMVITELVKQGFIGDTVKHVSTTCGHYFSLC